MNQTKVLVAPLDWGLGHAARCIPVIRELQNQNCEVQIGGAGRSLQLLKDEFPTVKHHDFPPYAPEYPAGGSMFWKLVNQLPKFQRAIRLEKACVDEIIKREGIDIVISDNRYGAWSEEVPCVFITHQLNILPPKHFEWVRPFIRMINYSLIKKFSRCWIPDLPTRKLTGALSLPYKKINSEYIGILSRFSKPAVREKHYDILVLLSGPEPQRTILEDVLMRQLQHHNSRILLVRGLVGEQPSPYSNANIEVVNSLRTEELQHALASSAVIIARSGYSTLMDLSVFHSKSILLPTPGQTEQVYLGKRLLKKGIAYACNQEDFQLQEALLKAQKLTGSFPEKEDALLSGAVKKLLEDVSVH